VLPNPLTYHLATVLWYCAFLRNVAMHTVMLTRMRAQCWSPQGQLQGLCRADTNSCFGICHAGSYTSCDGVPLDPDPGKSTTLAAPAAGRRLHEAPWTRTSLTKRCNTDDCCRTKASGRKYGCYPCKGCQAGKNVIAHVLSTKYDKCQCLMLGSCPVSFNKNCRYKNPVRN
jgi:hypothetical protein